MALTILIFLLISIKSSMAYSIVSQYPKVEKNMEVVAPVSENEINGNSIEELVENKPDSTQEPEEEFDGVYSECVWNLSFMCIQNKTLNYLKKLNEKPEVTLYGNFLKFVKTKKYIKDNNTKVYYLPNNPADEIDRKIDEFFGTRVLRIQFGKELKEDIDIGKMLESAEGRKKDKEDKGHKKMMMMAMMMMKMKMMMMMPVMMGMTGVIAFKALILGAISLLISKILLLMKLMGGGGKMGGQGGGHGADVTVWMPSGGSGGGMGGWDNHNSGGGGGGYNANGEWQNRAGWESPQILRGIRADRKKRSLKDNDDKENDIFSGKNLEKLYNKFIKKDNKKYSNISEKGKFLNDIIGVGKVIPFN